MRASRSFRWSLVVFLMIPMLYYMRETAKAQRNQ